MKPYWRDVVMEMNEKLYQMINDKYGDVVDFNEEEVINTIENLFKINGDTSKSIIIKNKLDRSNISETFSDYFNESTSITVSLENSIKNITDSLTKEYTFSSKDEEIKSLKRKLEYVNSEIESMKKNIDKLIGSHNHILDSYDALFITSSIDQLVSESSIKMVISEYENVISKFENFAYIEGYLDNQENISKILDRIDILDNSLTDTIRRN